PMSQPFGSSHLGAGIYFSFLISACCFRRQSILRHRIRAQNQKFTNFNLLLAKYSGILECLVGYSPSFYLPPFLAVAKARACSSIFCAWALFGPCGSLTRYCCNSAMASE